VLSRAFTECDLISRGASEIAVVVGLRQVGAGRDDNAAMAMHGLVVLNRPCLADALYAKFPLESYKYEYIFFSSLPLSPLIPALRGLSQRKRS